MDERIIQRTVFAVGDRPAALYHRATGPAAPTFPDRFSVRLAPGGRLTTDTYFNTFFEAHWRWHTRAARVALRLDLVGAGEIRLVRRSARAGAAVVGAATFAGASVRVVLDLPESDPDGGGLIHFELTAGDGPVLVRKAEWVATAVAAPVRLAVGCCTFDREARLLETVAGLLGDTGAAAAVGRVVVVDQGTRKVRRHADFARVAARAGDALRVVEQNNFGGAGGFTRAILEAGAELGLTHVVLMDDDIVLEPETVFRAAAFLSLARRDVAVGAPMLDASRPEEVCEAGGRVDVGRLAAGGGGGSRRVDTAAALIPFGVSAPADYNGWWFFAVPLRVVGRCGLPLPVFIRGDDAEYGFRLRAAGVQTVTLPGTGVWHEPFRRRAWGWQPYYDLRNMLVLAAAHRRLAGWRAARVVLGRVVSRLLRLDYREAELLCEAADDFCRGPDFLEDPPQTVHHKVMALARGRPLEHAARAVVPAARTPAARPESGYGRAALLCEFLFRQVARRTPRPPAAPTVLVGEPTWRAVGRADAVALDGPDPDRVEVLRRSRREFLRLLARAVVSAGRLIWNARRVAAEWRVAFPRQTSPAFWHQYLQAGATENTSDAPRRAG